MTRIRVGFTHPIEDSSIPGEITFAARHNEGRSKPVIVEDKVITDPERFEVPEAGTIVEVLPTGEDWHYQIMGRADSGHSFVISALVPMEAADPVDFRDLVQIDPRTGMEVEPEPRWWAEVRNVQEAVNEIAPAKEAAESAATSSIWNRQQAQTARAAAENARDTTEGYRNDLASIVDGAVADGFPQATYDSAGLMSANDKYATRAQTDYVALMASRSRMTRLQLRRASSGVVQISCLPPDGSSHITYEFGRPGDEYWYAGEVWAGAVTAETAEFYLWGDLSTTGEFTEATTIWTGDVGATFERAVTVLVDGSSVFLQHYTDTRGGIWKLTLGDREKLISTYRDTITDNVNSGFEDVKAGQYVLRGEFMGADPQNPPSSTPARGWLQWTGSGPVRPFVLVVSPTLSKDTLVAPRSNRDFALRIGQPGDATEFVPSHGHPTSVAIDPPVIYDGNTAIDPASLAPGSMRDIESCDFVQRIHGRNPHSGSTNLIEMWTSHRIYPDGRMAINGRWKALTDLNTGTCYVIMGPVRNDLFDRMVTSFRNEYPATLADGSSTYLEDESDHADSFAFLSASRPDIGMAFKYSNGAETVRRGAEGKDPSAQRSFLEHRNGSVLKHYQRIFQPGTLVPAGSVHRFAGEYIHVVAPGIADQFSLS